MLNCKTAVKEVLHRGDLISDLDGLLSTEWLGIIRTFFSPSEKHYISVTIHPRKVVRMI